MKKSVALILGGLLALGALRAAEKPNIIFILTDDLGWGDVGAFYQNQRKAADDPASPAHLTPNLDQMAAEGVRFTNQYAAAPVCASSRSSFITGMNQGNAIVRDNQFDRALEDNHTIASVLKHAGYTTGIIGKWGLQGPTPGDTPTWPAAPTKRGFDYYFGGIRHVDGHEHYPKEMLYFGEKKKTRGPVKIWENYTDVTDQLDKCYTTDLFTARAKKWITEQHETKKPFFLFLSYDTPHAVLELPTQPYPAGGGLKGGVQWLGTPGHMINTASGKIDSYVYPEYANATYDDDHNPATPEVHWPDVNQRYATDVKRIDDAIGDLFQLLKDLGIDKNTLVVFSSDNGPSIECYLPGEEITPEFFSSFGPFDGIKRDMWEGGFREPSIARWPGKVKEGAVIDRPSALFDWLSTFADAAGLTPPARSDGVSLLPEMTGRGTQRDPGAIYFEYFMKGRTPDFAGFEPGHRNRMRGQMQAIRVGDLMGVRYNVKSADDDFEIYDVVKDPKEAHNLAKEPAYAGLQADLKARALQSRRPEGEAPRPYDDTPVPAVKRAETVPGVSWSRYEGDFPYVPDLEVLKPVETGHAARPEVTVGKSKGGVGMLFTGYVDVPADGDYTFTLSTDTGAILRLHEALLIDADYGYKAGEPVTATIKLKAGLHPFRLFYAHGAKGDPSLDLSWSGPGLKQQTIPAAAFSTDRR